MRRWKVYKDINVKCHHTQYRYSVIEYDGIQHFEPIYGKKNIDQVNIKQPYIDFLNMKMDVLYWKALNNQNDNIISDWDSYLDYLEEGDSLMERWISWSYR